MSQDFLDETELPEEVLVDEDEEVTSLSDKFYIPRSTQPRRLKQVPLAFTVPDDLEPVVVEGCTISWTKTASSTLAEIQKGTRSDNGQTGIKNLPYASLRGLMEVGLRNASRIQANVGLSKFALHAREPEPFVYLPDDSEEAIGRLLRPLINDWFTNHLRPFGDREKLSPELLERLDDLREQGQLLTISPFKSHVLPWGWSEETGTTLPKDPKHAYHMLADYAARQIAGKELFQGLGPMRRIISSSGAFTAGVAELITNPLFLPDKKGRFSLVVRLEVITYPSLHQPLLKVNVSKRRWLSQLKVPGFDRSAIRGFVFPQECPDRAFSYWVLCKHNPGAKQEKGKKQSKTKLWQWMADVDFDILKREFDLPLSASDGQQIASGKASTDSCSVTLTYRNGLQDNSGEDTDSPEEYEIEAGVPETDKLEAFQKITIILQAAGLQAFEEYVPVKSKHSLDEAASRMINLPTLLGAMLETAVKGTTAEFTPQYLDQLSEDQLDSLFRKHFDFGLGEIEWGRKSLQFTKKQTPDQSKELQTLIQANQAATRRLYPNEKLTLFIFCGPTLQTEAKLLKAIIQVLWGEPFEILINHLPQETHGSRDELPGQELKAKERANRRVEAWRHIAQQIEKRKERTFCLILARRFFPDPSGQKRPKRDDRVNKPSTRQALASVAGACSQFLEPIGKTPKVNHLKLEKFFHRAQSALKDLLAAHSGHIDDLQIKVDKYLETVPPEQRPKEIIGITIVRKQKGRARGSIGTTFLPIAVRLQVDTGKCEMRFAYEKGNSLETSPWNSFPDALALISRISPIKLAPNREVGKNRFMEFVNQVISNSVDDGAQPLVLIDSSNCVHLWSWLADVRMNAHQINLGQQYQWMEKAWQGARLVRIRQDLAPGVIDEKVREYIETSLEDVRSAEELKRLPPDHAIPSTASSLGLFKLAPTNETGCVAYLSVGRKTLHKYSRGQSCFRSTEIHRAAKSEDSSEEEVCNKAGLKVYQIGERPAFSDHWSTPNPLEVVVTLRQPDDDPDELAALVESLRYSFGHYREWTSLPAPLFFERVVRDYISEFAIEDEEIEADPETPQ